MKLPVPLKSQPSVMPLSHLKNMPPLRVEPFGKVQTVGAPLLAFVTNRPRIVQLTDRSARCRCIRNPPRRLGLGRVGCQPSSLEFQPER